MLVSDMLGNRMKEYERRNQYWLQRRTPVAIRVDMKAGHSFTKGFQRPFDKVFVKSMQDTAKFMCENIQGAVLSFQQSDEITIILQDYKTLTTDAWFNYRTDKICSIAASMATMAFNKIFTKELNVFKAENTTFNTNEWAYSEAAQLWVAYQSSLTKGAMFDARCFNIPKEEVTNLIYWRQLDATRNSIQMVGQANFSHKELQNKSCNDIQDMLMLEKGINWNDFPTHQKRGSCCVRKVVNTTYKDICEEQEWGEPIKKTIVTYHYDWVIDTEIPIFKGEGREYIESRIQPEEE